VLLVHRSGDTTAAYSHYLRELLAVEGFADITEIDVASLPDALTANPDLLVLPRIQLSGDESDLVRGWLERGGRLLVLHPDQILAPKLGIDPTFGVLRDGVMRATPGGVFDGLPGDPVQVIVPVIGLTPGNGAIQATVTNAHDGFDALPAVIDVTVGSGRAIVFAFDLAKSVARLRHGDPDMADISAHRHDWIRRPSDLHVGQLDPRQGAVPQADILTATLARAIEDLAPQPRIWYYPDAAQRSVMLQTSDDDWSTLEQFEVMTAVLKQYDARCSFYVVHSSVLTKELMSRWEDDGHVFTVHPSEPWDNKRGQGPKDPQSFWVPAMIEREVERHRREYDRPVYTIRNHAIRWTGYVSQARLHAKLGIRGDANTFSVGQVNIGYVCGSGRNAPYVDLDGEVIDSYQIPSHWTEEALVNPWHTSSQNYNMQKAQALTGAVIRSAHTTYHTPTILNSHPVSFATYSQPLIEDNWKTARELGIPIQSADEFMHWTEARRAMTLHRTGNGYELSGQQSVPRAAVLFPAGTVSERASRQTIWGRDYDAVEITNLSAGETRHVGIGA
jgi:hypothetical protein